MIFWLIAGALVAIILAALLAPLRRRDAAPPAAEDQALSIYRDQLNEVERDLKRGVLNAKEAEAARLEVERRLLKASAAKETGGVVQAGAKGSTGVGIGLIATLAIAIPAGALGLYVLLGAPGLPSQPYADRQSSGLTTTDLASLVGQLEQRITQSPDDPQGWSLLARTYIQLGRYAEAATAFQKMIDLGDDQSETYASLGESLAAANRGSLGVEARKAFATALERDPRNPRARYYGGLAYAQDGRMEEALSVWQSLAQDSPADAPWRPLLMHQIAQLRMTLGLDTAQPQAPGPTAEDLAAAAELSAEERQAFVRSMVDRLAARLASEPDDLDGWLRLARAQTVLNEPAAARSSLAKARTLAQTLPSDAP